MPKKKLSSLSEQMFYVLLILNQEMCGIEIAETVKELTKGRVSMGAGTLYTILAQFEEEGMIFETKTEGRKRSYLITEEGRELLKNERIRLQEMIHDSKLLLEQDDEN